MSPEIGQIVLAIHHGTAIYPSIITAVNSENSVDLAVFNFMGNAAILQSSVWKDGTAGAGSLVWAPVAKERDILASAAPLEANYGGLNLLGLLGGDFSAIVGPLLVMLYEQNKTRISGAADRVMTPSQTAMHYVLDRLGIKNDHARATVIEAARAWGDKGGDLLEAIAKAKAMP